MGGDFNAPLSLQLDSYGSKTEKRDVVTKIRELMLDFNLVDIWRLRNPDKQRYTSKQNKPLIIIIIIGDLYSAHVLCSRRFTIIDLSI